MKLLIGYDGSRCSEAALDDLTHAGLPVKGEAMVISVAEVWLPPPPPSSLEIVELAVTAKGPIGLERKYMAGLRSGHRRRCNGGKSCGAFPGKLPRMEGETRSRLGFAELGSLFEGPGVGC